MRITQLLLVVVARAEKDFLQLIDRLFTFESLSNYSINYNDTYTQKHGAHVQFGKLNATHNYLNISVRKILIINGTEIFQY